MTYYAHTLVWPLLTAALAALLIYSFRGTKWRLLLFDPKQLSRHPVRFMLLWLFIVGVWLTCTALIYGLAQKTGLNSPMGGYDHQHVDH